MTEQLQIGLSLMAALGMILVLVGIRRAGRLRAEISSRLSRALAVPEAVSRARRVLISPEDSALLRSRGAAWAEREVMSHGLGRWVHRRIALAGIKIPTWQFLLMEAVMLVLGMEVALLASPHWLLGLLGALAGGYLPWWYVSSIQKRRREQFSLQLADTVSLLVGALRAGQSLPQAFQRVSVESKEPTASEMRQVVAQMKLGLSLSEALQTLARRVGSRDLDLLIAALEVQREVGGDIVMLMESMSEVMRERFRIRAEVSTISAQQRLSAQLLFMLPLFIALVLFLMSPRYMGQMFSPEVMPCGLPVLIMPITAGLLLLAGFLAVQKAAEVAE